MLFTLFFSAVVILSCIVANKFSDRFGIPALLLFMALGMLFGSDGIAKIYFDSFNLAEEVCTVALIFIMFYGGFGTNWSVAKPVAKKSILLSSVGVIITALSTCVFCHFILKINLGESFLIGSVISSTDAASVFSILRSQKLNLKDGTASLLEIESGSNDPVAYMMTIIGLMLINGIGDQSITYMIFSQIIYGILIGVIIAIAAIWVLQKLKFNTDGLETIFIIAIAILSYALPSYIGGNGYLSVYLTGIIIGNSKIKNKIILVHFFDGITILAQILIFFLLGLLSFPHKLIGVLIPAILITLFLTFVARPLSIFIILAPFKSSINQCLLVSWAGLRGAASIVFSIVAIASGVNLENDLFHIVFLIALLSVSIQGTLLPYISRKLDMVDSQSDVRKTFTDYQEESAMTLIRLFIPEGHNWENMRVSDVSMPTDSLALMIKRDGENIIPKGDTVILKNDSVILSVPSYYEKNEVNLKEIEINRNHKWNGKSIEELNLPKEILIAMIKRGERSIIPRGKTVIKENDIVVIYK